MMIEINRKLTRAWVVAVLITAAAPAGAEAQAFTLAGGSRTYDEEGVGSTLTAGLRSEFPIGNAALLEIASSIADHPDNATRSTASVYEAQLQLPIALGDVLEPYVGAGAGVAWTRRQGGDGNDLSGVLSVGAGVRAMFSEQLGIVLDARIRGIGTEFAGSHTDLTIGLRYRLVARDRPRFRGAPRSN